VEDQKRGMESPEKIIPPKDKKSHRVRDLTVMIIRGVGKVYSFKISSRIVFLATAFFAMYIPVSVFIIHDYFDLHRSHLTQSEMIIRLEKEISESKRDIRRFDEHISLLKKYIANLEKGEEQVGVPARSEDLHAQRPAPHMANTLEDIDEEEVSTSLVDVQDMVIQKKESRMTIDFKLVNTRPGENVVRGYLHIIAMGNDANPPPEWIHPKEKIQNGFPLNFRKGQLFLIQKYKPIHRKFNLVANSEPPTVVKVLVYDRAGMLILEKQFGVSDAS
jgi:hypothetical protein